MQLLYGESIKREIIRLIEWADSILICSPFVEDFDVTQDEKLTDFLKRKTRTKEIILLTKPPDPNETRKSALLTKLRKGGVTIYTNSGIHAKAVIAKRGYVLQSIIGSANLTGAGLHSNLELALKLDKERHICGEIRRLVNSFLDKRWLPST